MDIIVDGKHIAQLEKALATQTCKVRKFRNAEELIGLVEEIDNTLPPCKRKADKENVSFFYTVGCEHFANAYKYIPRGTCIECKYKNGNWHLISVSDSPCNRIRNLEVNFTDTFKNSIAEYYSAMTI